MINERNDLKKIEPFVGEGVGQHILYQSPPKKKTPFFVSIYSCRRRLKNILRFKNKKPPKD